MDIDGQDQQPRASLLHEIGGIGGSDDDGSSPDPQGGGWYSSGLFGRYPGELSVDSGFDWPTQQPTAAPLNPIRWYDDGSDSPLPRNTGLASVGGFVAPGEASDSGLTEASFALPPSASINGRTPPTYDAACNYTPAVDFVKAHRDEAAEVAKRLNVPIENVLGLSAEESEWGRSRFAVQANNFFGQHAGAAVPFATGSLLASGDGPMSKFPSYPASARAFEALYGNAVRGVNDPEAFAKALVGAKFNSGDPKTGGRKGFVPYTASVIQTTKRRMSCP